MVGSFAITVPGGHEACGGGDQRLEGPREGLRAYQEEAEEQVSCRDGGCVVGLETGRSPI